jgi:hypothetical protein
VGRVLDPREVAGEVQDRVLEAAAGAQERDLAETGGGDRGDDGLGV